MESALGLLLLPAERHFELVHLGHALPETSGHTFVYLLVHACLGFSATLDSTILDRSGHHLAVFVISFH